ncbi:phosphate ABC transporter permease subunit PstC [Lactobacillus corticis]|uniref:Phosphate transport system permease protein n=1 Tax=Lactobacillus corticis TaxID=2201249 RepID=A0A916VIG2_9LACO|nr:phosphate ABC transporter permease subunit PstC [Lactobacillus corticis]GFZ27767.1 phosphate ABC transporter permease protein [Lactobacillus corticis]
MDADIKKRLLSPSKATKQERRGKTVTFITAAFIIVLTFAIIVFIANLGLRTFYKDNVNIWEFLTGTAWNPGEVDSHGHPIAGAAPMIVTSILVTLLSAVIATPFALAIGVYMTEYASKRQRQILRPMIELFTGIPSVVYGFLGLTILVPLMRNTFGGTGFGILPAILVLFFMILPTITSMTVDALKAVPVSFRQAALALGATKWQSIYKIVFRAALPGIFTAIIFGMSRAFGEALAVQMVIGNSILMPENLVSPTSTLTSQLTSQIGNTIMGSVQNDALWSLALILLLMSLFFNVLVRFITKKGKMNGR